MSFGGTHSPVEIEKPPVNWDTSTGFNVPLPTTVETAEMSAGGGSFQRMLQSTYRYLASSRHNPPLRFSGRL